MRTGENIIALNVDSGEKLWSFGLSRQVLSSPAISYNGLVFVTDSKALWALDEVASQLNEPEFDKLIWPHVKRKAKLIVSMLSNNSPVYKSWSGDIVPDLLSRILEGDGITKGYGSLWLMLVAEPARDGLIIGKVDNQFPLLYVNAVSFRGLLSAAAIADRLGHGSEAIAWRNHAIELKNAWEKSFSPPETSNDRTYICGLWPTGIAESIK